MKPAFKAAKRNVRTVRKLRSVVLTDVRCVMCGTWHAVQGARANVATCCSAHCRVALSRLAANARPPFAL